MVQQYFWRTGWFVLALLTVALTLLGWFVVRNRPADLGQHPDGIEPASDIGEQALQSGCPSVEIWTLRAALWTPQFAVLCLSATACFVPGTVCTMHSRMHLGPGTLHRCHGRYSRDNGPAPGRRSIDWRTGWFSGSRKGAPLCVARRRRWCVGVVVCGKSFPGVGLDALARLRFGAASISLAVVLAKFFGPVVFAQLLGVNYLIAGILQAISPGLAGWTHDLTDSYRIAFISATLLSTLEALCTWFLRVPSPPGGIESMPG